MDPIRAYIEEGKLPTDSHEVRKLCYKAAQYVLEAGVLYRRGYTISLLKCVHPQEVNKLSKEVHEGCCGAHSAGRSLVKQIATQGYH